MATEKFANNASTTLNGSIIAGASSLTVTSAAGFPSSGQFRILVDNEIIIVGAVSGTTFSSLTRGAETTTDTGHSNGATITHILTAGGLTNLPVAGTQITSAIPGGYGGGLVLLESHTAATSATLDFTTRNATGQSGATFQSDFDEYVIELINLVSVTNGVGPWIRVSTNGGSTYDSSSIYSYVYLVSTAAGGAISGAASQAQFLLTNATNAPNTASEGGLNGSYKLFNPLSATQWKHFFGGLSFRASDGTRAWMQNNCTYESITAVNAFRFLYSSGSITSGTIRVYGIAKS